MWFDNFETGSSDDDLITTRSGWSLLGTEGAYQCLVDLAGVNGVRWAGTGGGSGITAYQVEDPGSENQYAYARQMAQDSECYLVCRAQDKSNFIAMRVAGLASVGFRATLVEAGAVSSDIIQAQGYDDGWHKIECDGNNISLYTGGTGTSPGSWSQAGTTQTESTFNTETTQGIATTAVAGTIYDHVHFGSLEEEIIQPTDAYQTEAWTSASNAWDGVSTTAASKLNGNSDPSISFGGATAGESTDSWDTKAETWSAAKLKVKARWAGGGDDSVGIEYGKYDGSYSTVGTLKTLNTTGFDTLYSATLSESDFGTAFANIADLRVRVRTSKAATPDGLTAYVSEVWVEGTISASAHHAITPDAGSITITGVAPSLSLTEHWVVTPAAGSVVITGAAPTLLVGGSYDITPDAGSITITGATPAVVATASYSISPAAGAITITGVAPAVASTAKYTISPAAGSITITGAAPTAAWTDHHIISPAAGAIVITGAVPTVDAVAGYEISPDAGSITITGAAPTVDATAHHAISPTAGAITITGAAASLTIGIAPSAGAITITGKVPSVATTASHYISPAAGTVVFTGAVPTVAFTFIPTWVDIGNAANTWTDSSSPSNTWTDIAAAGNTWT